jgi:uncharacterized RDD family membrane protein YckC
MSGIENMQANSESNTSELPWQAPSLMKLGACILYELLTLMALLFVSASIFLWCFGDASNGLKRLALQLFLWGVIGAYYVWCWLKSGQTLAMQAWKIKLVTRQNRLLDLNLTVIRYILATLSVALFGLGFMWAIFDRKNLFLHDRLLHTKLILSSVDVTQHSQAGK